MAVAGPGNPALDPAGTRGVLRGHQPEVGADGAAGQPMPVADFDGQSERGQCRNPAHTAQSRHHRGELRVSGHLLDRAIEAVAAIDGGQHCLEARVVGQLQRGSSNR